MSQMPQVMTQSGPQAQPLAPIIPIHQIGIFEVLEGSAMLTSPSRSNVIDNTGNNAGNTTSNNVIYIDFTPKASPKTSTKIAKDINVPSTHNIPTTPETRPIFKTSTNHPNTTTAITDPVILEAIKEKLLYSSPTMGLRNYIIFYVGINIGLRAGDLLTLRIGDVWDENTQTVKPEITIVEEKTHKDRLIFFNPNLQADLKDYILSLPNHEPAAPLFQSRKKKAKYGQRSLNRSINDTGCLEANSYGKILREIGKQLNLEHFCTHSMRKTCVTASNNYCSHHSEILKGIMTPLDVSRAIANHASTKTTAHYIDDDKNVMRNVANAVRL